MLARILLVLPFLLMGCSDRTLGSNATGTTGDPIERPESGMWSACADQSDCGDLPLCVFPSGELGFCTQSCELDLDCPASYAPPDHPVCVPLGDERPSCALDCGGGVGCPTGMRCLDVDTPEGARKLCF